LFFVFLFFLNEGQKQYNIGQKRVVLQNKFIAVKFFLLSFPSLYDKITSNIGIVGDVDPKFARDLEIARAD